MVIAIVQLIFGVIALWKGGDFLVKGAADLAKRFNISELIIGLTLVAFGTSAPELVVNIIAAKKNEADIVFGNILGSNISNVLLILGLTGIILPIKVPKKNIKINAIIVIFSVVILAGLIMGSKIVNNDEIILLLSRSEGGICMLLFTTYLIFVFKQKDNSSNEHNETKVSILIPTGLFLLGSILLPFGGQSLITAIQTLANLLSVPTALLSLFLLAISTSLPELAACLVAAIKHHPELALGNILGSNICNILLILGVSSVINPLTFSTYFRIDLLWVLGSSLILLIIIMLSKEKISSIYSWLLLLGYTLYVSQLMSRFI
ncbi:MAG: sodium:calcium antiporter [bacterium]